MICCVTTGASQMMSLEERLAPIPALQPELATCNAGSMNFVLADIAEKIPDGCGWGKALSHRYSKQHLFQHIHRT